MASKKHKWISPLIIGIALISCISTTKAQTTADDMLRRADELAAQDHARRESELEKKCDNWLKTIEKGMRENEAVTESVF
jgi:hypothetical protein